VAAGDGYFVFRGIGDHHLDAVEAVLERHGLAIVAVVDGELRLVGEITDDERRAWTLLHAVGPADARALADAAGCDEAAPRPPPSPGWPRGAWPCRPRAAAGTP
jgi:hypothetical protein